MMRYQLPINILLADDHQIITDGMSKILEAEKSIGKIYIANNGKDAVDLALQHDIDCVIIDINMPQLNGFEAAKLIKKDKPQVKIIVVTMLCDASVVNKMLKAGADAFLNKDSGKDELLKAITIVMNDEKYVSAEIALNFFSKLSTRNINTADTEKHLTTREIEIVRSIADGLTNNEIATKLFLSTVTVDTHRKNILTKLHLKNTATLVKYAAEHKLL